MGQSKYRRPDQRLGTVKPISTDRMEHRNGFMREIQNLANLLGHLPSGDSGSVRFRPAPPFFSCRLFAETARKWHQSSSRYALTFLRGFLDADLQKFAIRWLPPDQQQFPPAVLKSRPVVPMYPKASV